MLVEQTEIARRLGISNKSFRKMVLYSHLKDSWKLIAQKRHYEIEEVFALIKLSNQRKTDEQQNNNR